MTFTYTISFYFFGSFLLVSPFFLPLPPPPPPPDLLADVRLVGGEVLAVEPAWAGSEEETLTATAVGAEDTGRGGCFMAVDDDDTGTGVGMEGGGGREESEGLTSSREEEGRGVD